MDFIIGWPRTVKQHDSIMVVVDRLTKVTNFILVMSTFSASDLAQLFIKDMVIFHGVPRNIVSDEDVKFTSKFWKDLFACMGTELAFNTTYHPHIDGQIERVNKILEDMLRMNVMHQQHKWEEYLPLVEFAYNNGYQESLKMSPFEAIYGWSCNTPISWIDLMNRVVIGPDMLAEME